MFCWEERQFPCYQDFGKSFHDMKECNLDQRAMSSSKLPFYSTSSLLLPFFCTFISIFLVSFLSYCFLSLSLILAHSLFLLYPSFPSFFCLIFVVLKIKLQSWTQCKITLIWINLWKQIYLPFIVIFLRGWVWLFYNILFSYIASKFYILHKRLP